MMEMGAYEALWARQDATAKRVADIFRKNPDALPSDLVPRKEAAEKARWVIRYHEERGVTRFGVRVHRAGEYPAKLRDARHPVEVLQFRGMWNLVEAPSVAVVGTRKPSKEGLLRTQRLVKHLVRDDFIIVSGLAAGVDTMAHETALSLGAPSIAVLGTPISDVYPAANRALQDQLAEDHLIVSEVPVFRYARQTWRLNRGFFPARNVTMSALTAATIIVEAGNTSGTLFQARAALHQGRRLFILDSCFRNPELTWPADYAKKGAVRVKEYEEIAESLKPLRAGR
jgi:DNA processing protein